MNVVQKKPLKSLKSRYFFFSSASCYTTSNCILSKCSLMCKLLNQNRKGLKIHRYLVCLTRLKFLNCLNFLPYKNKGLQICWSNKPYWHNFRFSLFFNFLSKLDFKKLLYNEIKKGKLCTWISQIAKMSAFLFCTSF